MAPAVLTETVYALACARSPAFIPTQVHLISTQAGAKSANEMLLEGSAHFLALCRDYGLNPAMFGAANIHHVCDAQGQPLTDIRTADDNEFAADFITEAIRQHTANEHTAVHVSMAGGRKTMGYYAGYALSLFGRDQDRLSHVLVPEEFETLPGFYYPTTKRKWLTTKDGREKYDASKATVELAEIPFVRMRGELPAKVVSENRLLNQGFRATIKAAEDARNAMTISLDMVNLEFRLGRYRLEQELGAAPLALLCWLAARQHLGKDPIDPRRIEHDRDYGRAMGQQFLRFTARVFKAKANVPGRKSTVIRWSFSKQFRQLEKTVTSLERDGFASRTEYDARLAKLRKEMAHKLGPRVQQRFVPMPTPKRNETAFRFEAFDDRFHVTLSKELLAIVNG